MTDIIILWKAVLCTMCHVRLVYSVLCAPCLVKQTNLSCVFLTILFVCLSF